MLCLNVGSSPDTNGEYVIGSTQCTVVLDLRMGRCSLPTWLQSLGHVGVSGSIEGTRPQEDEQMAFGCRMTRCKLLDMNSPSLCEMKWTLPPPSHPSGGGLLVEAYGDGDDDVNECVGRCVRRIQVYVWQGPLIKDVNIRCFQTMDLPTKEKCRRASTNLGSA